MSKLETSGSDLSHATAEVALEAAIHFRGKDDGYARGETGFVSKSEWFPSCTYELRSLSRLHEVRLVLESPEPDPVYRFTILTSIDGLEWSPRYSRTRYARDLEPGQPYIIRFVEALHARFIKIRLDGYGVLAIADCTMSGEIENGFALQSKVLARATEREDTAPRVAFSILFTESEDYLLRLVDNFLSYTDERCFLFINLSPGRVLSEDMPAFSSRVVIFSGETPREKWGHTLLIGHIECYLQARATVADLGYFCTLSSNCLFVRSFDIDSTLEQVEQKYSVPVGCERNYENDLDVPVGTVPSECSWMWEHFAGSTKMHSLIRDDLGLDCISATQVEGLFASAVDWGMVADRLSVIRGIEPFLKPNLFMALEECLPISIFRRFGSGHYTFICYMLWRGARIATVEEVLNLSSRLPAHLSVVKWFDRNIPAPSTDLVTTPWGRELVTLANTHRQTAPIEAFHHRALLSRVARWMSDAEQYKPLSSRWGDEIRDHGNGYVLSLPGVRIDRRVLPLCDIASVPAGSGFLFLEGTGELARITVGSVPDIDADRIFIASSSDRPSSPNVPDHEDVVGYLYLSAQRPAAVFRLSVALNSNDESLRVSRRIVLHHGGNYIVTSPILVEEMNGQRNFYFTHSGSKDSIWIGLPVYRNKTAEVFLSILNG